MAYKLKVSWTEPEDKELLRRTEWKEHKIIHPEYEKEFDTKEQLALYVLDLPKEVDEEIILSQLDPKVDVYEVEVYNDYRE